MAAPELLKVPPQRTPLHDDGIDHPEQSRLPRGDSGVFGGSTRGRIFSKVWWKFFHGIVDWINYLVFETTGVSILGAPVTGASQTTSDLKGDHLSAHMFNAKGQTRYVRDAAMTAGLATLTSASASFTADDVGKTITVMGAGSAGEILVSSISTFGSSSSVTLADVASTSVSGARIVFGVNETDNILDLLLTPNGGVNPDVGGTGGGVQRLIPSGVYFVTPGELLIPNPQSGMLIGQGSRFNTALMSADPTSSDAVLTLGNGTWEPHSYVMENITVDLNFGLLGLYLNRTNLMVIRDVIIQTIGEDGIGIDTPSSPELFGEMIFDHVGVLGGDDGPPPVGSIGMRIYATSNVTLQSCNIEVVQTGLIFEGSTQCALTIIGGRWERIPGYSMILTRCQPIIFQESSTGNIYIANDVVNGNINLQNNAGSWTNGSIVDNGFGNRIVRTSSQPHFPISLSDNAKAVYATGLNFNGDEWLSVENLNSDPTFLNGETDWTAGAGAVLFPTPVCMPGVRAGGGAGMIIQSTAGGGYAEQQFTAEVDTDYLLQVGILCRGTETYKIQVLDSGTTIYDSGDLTQTFANGDQQAFKVFRKRIPVASDTVFKVRIYSMNALQETVVSMVLISKSQIRMETDYVTAGSGFSTTGSGAGYTWIQDTAGGGHVYTVKATSARGRAFVRAVVTVPPGVEGAMGVVENGNSLIGGPEIYFREGTHEYIVPLMSHPVFNTVTFYSFVFGGPLEIQDVGVFSIDELPPLPKIGQGWVRNDPGGGSQSLTTHNAHLYLGGNFNSNMQAASSAANAFTRCIYASNMYWDEDAGVWQILSNGASDWAALLMLNSGEIGIACETGLSLPTTRTNTQVLAAIKFKIPTSGGIQILGDGYIDLISSTIQLGIRISAGDPNGVVSGLAGMICLDDTGGLWLKTGSPGTSDWVDVKNIWFSTDAPTNSKYRTNKQLGIGKDPGAFDLDVNGAVNLDSTLKMNALTASRPLKLNSSKQLTASKIDMGDSNDVQATGLSSGEIMFWDGSKVDGVGAGVSVSLTEIDSGPFSDTVLQDVSLSGTVPPGLTLTKSTISVVTGFGVSAHASTNGIVTS